MEAAIVVLALGHGLLPGTCNLEQLDDRLDLAVLAEPMRASPDAVLSTSFGFGGLNAALVVKRA
jgi:3-oxoacyl-[acyl-carrier-protein] synthase II